MSKKIFWGGRFDDIWWLEYLEGEFEPSMQKDLQLLLENSPFDRKRLRQLESARRLIKDADEVALPEDGRVYSRLHDRIMACIEEIGSDDENETGAPVDIAPGDFAGETCVEDDESHRVDDAKRSWAASVWCAFTRRWTQVQTKKLDFAR